MTRLCTTDLPVAARLGHHIVIHRGEHSTIRLLDSVSEVAGLTGHIGSNSPADITDGDVTAIEWGPSTVDPAVCLSLFDGQEQLRLAADLTLHTDDPLLTRLLADPHDRRILETAADAAHSGRHSEAMYGILEQLLRPDGPPCLTDDFLQRWALPLALLCGGHQQNNQLGFLYWMNKHLACDPQLLPLITRRPGLWLAYLHQCVVTGYYDVLTGVLCSLLDHSPELVRSALIYLFTLSGMTTQALLACALSGTSDAVKDLRALLLYFPCGSSGGVYERYTGAVEQILRNTWLQPALPGGDIFHGVVYDFARLRGYLFALTSSLCVCFISKDALSGRNDNVEPGLLYRAEQTLPDYFLTLADPTMASIYM